MILFDSSQAGFLLLHNAMTVATRYPTCNILGRMLRNLECCALRSTTSLIRLIDGSCIRVGGGMLDGVGSRTGSKKPRLYSGDTRIFDHQKIDRLL